jgi:DNA-binding response OmpR family regulator
MIQNKGNRRPQRNNHTVLIIEDHIETAMSLVVSLNQAGCEVSVATSKTQALQLVEKIDINLIAIAPDLPEVCGFETFLHLRTIPSLAATPIIFIARRFDDASWRRGLELGAADYIEKPFDCPAFVRRILSHIKPRSRANVSATKIL